MGFTIEHQTSIRAYREGLTVRGVPTHEHEHERFGGRSGARALPTGPRFLRLFARDLRGGRPPVPRA